MTTNNDILCRWRDAISDPPDDNRAVLLHGANADELLVAYRNGTAWHEWEGLIIRIDPGDQWLDITTIPGVAREAVQAAVDEINMEMIGPEDEWPIRILNYHTGLLPTEEE